MSPVQALFGTMAAFTPGGRLWLLPLFPLLGALVSALFGRRLQARFGARAVHGVVVGAMALSALFAVAAVVRLCALPPSGRLLLDRLYGFVPVEGVNVDVTFALDPLSAVMVLVITLVGTLIHVYAMGYMAGEASAWRFFAYLNLFVFSMLVLVLADSLLVLFIGWEGVGVCSYLLIGFWYGDAANASAGRKAFVANRVGDLGLLAALGFLLAGLSGTFAPEDSRLSPELLAARSVQVQPRPQDEAAGPGTLRVGPTLSVHELRAQLTLENRDGTRLVARQLVEARVWGVPLLLLVGLGLFLGMSGKSAQIPLYVWLPDAMAGPTPVSALIHAATMVTAGVYLAARLSFLLAWTPETMTVVAVAGALTALAGALFAVFQHDIKKVLAYSTISQLGFMFLAVGVGAYGAGVFHVVTHACFKACLFLGAGSVIHAMHAAVGGHGHRQPADLRVAADPHDPQDLRNMGGLGSFMPRTRLAYLAGTLALAGVPVAAGFYSKDEILWRAFTHGNVLVPGGVLLGAGLLAACLTAFYSFRSYYLAFAGRARPAAGDVARLHEAPGVMTWPVLALAAAAIASGPVLGWPEVWGGHPLLERFLSPVLMPAAELTHFRFTPRAWPYLLQVAGVAVAVLGWACARALYRDVGRNQAPLTALRGRLDGLHRLLWHRLYVDEFYRALFVSSALRLARASAWLDRHLVDGLVRLVARSGLWLSRAGGWLDRVVVDGAVGGVAAVTLAGGRRLQRLQSGRINNYVLGIALGAAMLVVLAWVMG